MFTCVSSVDCLCFGGCQRGHVRERARTVRVCSYAHSYACEKLKAGMHPKLECMRLQAGMHALALRIPRTFASASASSSAAANSSSKDRSSLYWSRSQGREEATSSLAFPNSPAA